MPGAPPTDPRASFDRVVVAGGHMVDRPDRPAPRFPAGSEGTVTSAIGSTLDRWVTGRGTLIVCGGARGADIIAAEQGLARGADAWLLIAIPEADHLAGSVELPGTDWADRYRNLRRRCPTWFQDDELPPLQPGEDPFERNNEWSLRVGIAQAPPHQLFVLAVWDGAGADGPGGTSHLLERARAAGATVETIHPRTGTAS
ncbi:MAG TPA: hypothetical protein VHM89_02755 [Acidimicrobiales bacterium]|nr:hypothetical protein [Acidimicrobiales bacterium]